ncbi:MAG: hypothetical protein EBU84_21875 [Actinobacteria bacterium]|nr:hypothetical protein [Actinomycetota bacterium]
MMKINSAGNARGKLRLNTTPEDLRMIANRLEECAKGSSHNQTVEMDVSSEPLIITFEYHPVKQVYVSQGQSVHAGHAIDFASSDPLVC